MQVVDMVGKSPTKRQRGPGKPFGKGNPGGPGRPPEPPELKEAKRLNKTNFELLINKYLWASDEQLAAALAHPKTPMVEAIMIRILQEAKGGGDQGRMEWVSQRLLGKVKDQVEISAKPFAVERLSGEQVVLGIEAKVEDADES